MLFDFYKLSGFFAVVSCTTNIVCIRFLAPNCMMLL